MGKRAGKNQSSGRGGGEFSTLDVDPRRVRYAHSKIKPLFSGCGRTIEQTLCEIRDGKTQAADLPMITVLLGPLDPSDGQQWFFSLNNRRLFVFKACQEEGLLGPSGLVRVRARAMKAHEHERYTLDRCSVQAKFLFVPKPPPITTAPLLSPSTGLTEPGTSEAAAGEGQGKPEEKYRREEENPGPRPASIREELEVQGPLLQVGESTANEQGKDRGHARSMRREEGDDEGKDEAGTEKDQDRGGDFQSPGCDWASTDRPQRVCDSGGGDDTRAAGHAFQPTKVEGSVDGKKGRRRKAKGKRGAVREGGGVSDEEAGRARHGDFEDVPVALSRKQERARNGRRQRPS
eukprot:g7464.t1